MSFGRRSLRSREDFQRRQPFISYNTDTEVEILNTPNNLFYALQGLSVDQKSDIRDMGFESMSSFSIDNIPPGLGYWLLVNYDHKRNELNMGSHIIKITPSKVHDVLGVPMGGIPVSEKRNVRKGDAIREEWRKQFSRVKITVDHVIKKLKSYRKGGTLFKINFLVLFNTIMGEITTSAAVNQNFLTSIMNEGDISNMDWCGYIITCLKRTKQEWKSEEPYNGPLTFLAVLYAHELKLKSSPENMITPAIQYVTTDYLVDLDEVQAAADQTVIVLQDEEDGDRYQSTSYVTGIHQNGKGPCLNDNVEGQTSSFTSVGDDTQNMMDGRVNRCNHLELLRGENLQHDDEHIEILELKQEVLEDNVYHSQGRLSSYGQRDMVFVKGYKVNRGIAPTLVEILKKHGDFAVACVLKSDLVISSILESVCELFRQIQTNVIKNMSEAERLVSDAKAVHFNVSWLEALLESVRKRKEANKEYCLSLETKADVMRLKRLAQKDLRDNRAELLAAHQRLNENERLVKALHVVGKHLTDHLKSKADPDSWVNDLVV